MIWGSDLGGGGCVDGRSCFVSYLHPGMIPFELMSELYLLSVLRFCCRFLWPFCYPFDCLSVVDDGVCFCFWLWHHLFRDASSQATTGLSADQISGHFVLVFKDDSDSLWIHSWSHGESA